MDLIDRLQNEVLTLNERVDLAGELAYELMQGNPAAFKQGYTFANALNTAAEAAGLTRRLHVAMAAENLHARLAPVEVVGR